MALDPTGGGWSLTPVGTSTPSTAALAPQPQFSPDQIRQMRAEAMALQQPPKQNIQSWTQGLAELVRAIQGNREADFARQAEQHGRQQAADAVSQIYAPYLSPGGGDKPPPGAGAASADASGGGSADASAVPANSATSAAATPRGMRNNNPLNIEDGPFAQSQPGYAGSDGRFAKFNAQENGISAADKLLSTYDSKYGLNTVAGIINRWAPQADGNNVSAYADAVAKKLGIGPNDPIPPGMRQQLIAAMAEHENGVPLHAPGMVGATPPAPKPTGLFAPFQSATANPTPPAASSTPPAPQSTPTAAAAAPRPPVRLAYAAPGLPAGAVPATPAAASANGAAPPPPPAPPTSPMAPMVNAINGKPVPPPISPEDFRAAVEKMEADKAAAAANAPPLPKPSAQPVPPEDFVAAVKAMQTKNDAAPVNPSPAAPAAAAPPPSPVPLPQPRPPGAPVAVSPTVAPLVSAIAGQPPAPPAGAPPVTPPTRVAQNGPLTTPPPAAPVAAPSPSGLPQPLTSAVGQVSREQLTRVLANPWVPDAAKTAMLQMIQQRGQPQSMPVEGGTLMYNSAGQRVFIPEPKFGTIKIGGAEIPTVSHFDPATRRWNTTTLAPGGGVQTPGGAATGQAPAPGEPDLSTIGGIQRAEAAQAGAKKAEEVGAEQRAKTFNTIHTGISGDAFNAARQEPIIATMQRIAPAAMTGTGSDIALELNRVASQLGINPQGAAPRELFNQLSAKLLGDQFANIRNMSTEEGSPGGRIFKSMLDLEEKANITPTDSLEGVQAKLAFMAKAGQMLQRWGDMADDYAAAHGGKLDEGFMKGLRKDIAAQKFDDVLPRADASSPTGMKSDTSPDQNRAAIEAEMRKRGLLPAAAPAAPVSQ